MAGVLNALPAQAPARPAGMGLPPEQGGQPQDDIQQLALEAAKKGREILQNPAVMKQLVEAGKTGNGIRALAATIAMICDKVEDTMGGQLPLPVLEVLARVLLADAVDTLKQIGFQIQPDEAKAVMQLAVKLWMQKNGQRVKPEELAAMQQGA